MKHGLKHFFALLLGATLITTPIPWAHAEELSFSPAVPCKKPPKSPPKKMLERFFPEIEGDTDPAGYGVANRPFETNVDINGDGWCDWVSLGGAAPHHYFDTPPMKHFLFLGTKNDWRHFGNMKNTNYPPARIEGPRLLHPEEMVAAFQDPLFLYSPPQHKPYIIVTRTTKDTFEPRVHDVDIYRWNDDLDMPELLTLKARAPIILFLLDNACKNPALIPPRAELSSHQTLDAICEGRTRYCDTWNNCRDGKTPLCDQHGNCDEYSVWEVPLPPGASAPGGAPKETLTP